MTILVFISIQGNPIPCSTVLQQNHGYRRKIYWKVTLSYHIGIQYITKLCSIIPRKIQQKHDEVDPHRRYPEVLFPNFTSQQPWKEEANFAEVQEKTIPIFKLSHITHNIEAERIQGKHSFTFVPRMKLAKSYQQDGSPFGETYKEVAENEYL